MAYTKPEVVAQNSAAGSYAAGCPVNENSSSGYDWTCRECERTQ